MSRCKGDDGDRRWWQEDRRQGSGEKGSPESFSKKMPLLGKASLLKTWERKGTELARRCPLMLKRISSCSSWEKLLAMRSV